MRANVPRAGWTLLSFPNRKPQTSISKESNLPYRYGIAAQKRQSLDEALPGMELIKCKMLL